MAQLIDPVSLPDQAPQYDLVKLLEAGVHFGHQVRKWHPKMAPYIYMEKDGIHIFDLAKTAEQLRLAYNYLYNLGKNGKTVIFVGTKRQARDIIQTKAVEVGAMHITSRWLGGTLTNWEQVRKSIKRMNDLEKGLETGTFEVYTKYEQGQMAKELIRLQRFFAGIKDLKKEPDAIVIVDPTREDNVIKEATSVGVPIIALADSNADPRDVTIAIPGNDDAMSSIQFIVSELANAYAEGKKASA